MGATLVASKARMSGVDMRRSALAVVLLLATAVASEGADSSTEPAPGNQTESASALTVGFGVSPLRAQLPAPLAAVPGGQGSESGRPGNFDNHGSALSFDVTLRWPGADTVPLEPYLTVGPALFVVEPDYPGRLLGTRVDPAYHLGARAGAGLNWRLGKDVTLFGAYEVTTTADSALPSFGAKPGADAGVTGYDFIYGLRIRY
jgi:hypothetical protein